MQIRRLNLVDNPQDLAAVYPAFQQWVDDYLPGLPPTGESRLRFWSANGYRQHSQVLGAFADEQASEAEGVAFFRYSLDKNLNLTGVDVYVPAKARTGDAERALFNEATRLTAELGRKRLCTGIPETMDPAAFIARHGGAKYTDTAINSTLDLSTIDRSQYAQWAEPSAKNAEYTLVRWIDRCPDELAESYCKAMDAMADQPLGTFEYEFAENDLERLRFQEEQSVEYGVRRYVQAAVDPEGNVAGFHVLSAYSDESTIVDVWDTGVARSHRGHGLGLRVKAAAALWLLEDRPDSRWVTTFNNDENRWMLAVNRTLGYKRPVRFMGYEFAV